MTGVELNTAVQVVIDLSGSMKNEEKSQVAMESAVALVEAIERTGVAYASGRPKSPSWFLRMFQVPRV